MFNPLGRLSLAPGDHALAVPDRRPLRLLFFTKAILILQQQLSLLAAASDMQAAELANQIIIFGQDRIQDGLMAAVKIRGFPKALKGGTLIQVADRIQNERKNSICDFVLAGLIKAAMK